MIIPAATDIDYWLQELDSLETGKPRHYENGLRIEHQPGFMDGSEWVKSYILLVFPDGQRAMYSHTAFMKSTYNARRKAALAVVEWMRDAG